MTTIRSEPAAAAGFPANALEHALSAAVRDKKRVAELLEELCRSRLWLPLPDDEAPVTDGQALNLPTVRYLDDEFVPAYTSVGQLNEVLGKQDLGTAPEEPPPGELASGVQVPHAVVPAAELARLLPTGLGIALNPGAVVSVPIYPDDVAYLASTHTCAGGARVSFGRPPTEPTRFLSAVAAGLRSIPAAQSATRVWLTTDSGQGLIINVTLDHPSNSAAQQAVIAAVTDAVAVAGPRFPVDVAFPGECEPGPLEEWTAEHAPPFYLHH